MADNELLHLRVPFFTIAATAATIQYVSNPLPYPVRLKSAQFMPHAALTASDANYRSLAIAKGGTAAVTTKTTQTSPTGTGDLVAGTAVTLALSTASSDPRRLEPGEVHTVSATHTASGVAISGTFELVYEPVR